MSTDVAPVKIAILGAGIFTKNDYIPLFRHTKEVQVCALWSRSRESTESLLPLISGFAPEVQGLHGEDGLTALLQDAATEAVAVILPVQVMLQVATRALKAGKHVMQEKPIANSVKAAASAIAEHRVQTLQPVWALAENYRSEQAFRKAAEITPSLGTIIKISKLHNPQDLLLVLQLDLVADMPMNPANKYFNSQWRRDAAACPGGFVTDSSVHHIAALRALAQASGFGEVVEASALAMSVCEELPPPDTVLGSLKFAGGKPASVSISFAGSVLRFSLSVTGTKGSLEVLRGGWEGPKPGYTVSYQTAGNASHVELVKFCGLDDELMAFVDQVRSARHTDSDTESLHDARQRTAPEEGARDLAVIEALLQSSQMDGKAVQVKDIPVAS